MVLARRLYELQQIDLELEAHKDALARIQRELGDSEEVTAARQRLAADQERLALKEKEQTSLEAELEDLRVKVRTLGEQLYDSRKTPKELSALQSDISSRQTLVKQKEDSLLEVMAEVERLREREAADARALDELEQKRAEQLGSLRAEETRLTQLIEVLGRQRQEAISAVGAEGSQLYQSARPARGAGVVRVERGRCGGCRIGLSVSELQRARTGNIVRCSNCGRILFLE